MEERACKRIDGSRHQCFHLNEVMIKVLQVLHVSKSGPWHTCPQAAATASTSSQLAKWRTHQTHGGGHCLIHVSSDPVTVLLHVMVMCTGSEMFESNFRAVLCP